jgi:hypothetical protein
MLIRWTVVDEPLTLGAVRLIWRKTDLLTLAPILQRVGDDDFDCNQGPFWVLTELNLETSVSSQALGRTHYRSSKLLNSVQQNSILSGHFGALTVFNVG